MTGGRPYGVGWFDGDDEEVVRLLVLLLFLVVVVVVVVVRGSRGVYAGTGSCWLYDVLEWYEGASET